MISRGVYCDAWGQRHEPISWQRLETESLKWCSNGHDNV